MNPFSRNDWKKAAWKAVNHSEKAGPGGWTPAGALLIHVIALFILKSCLGICP
jgi:hypothetical protein